MDFEAYNHVQMVQQFGWKCFICSIEAKDQMGLEEQHITDGVVYTDNNNRSKWVFCSKCKKTYHVDCVCPNKEQPTRWPFLCTFNECRTDFRYQAGRVTSHQAGNYEAGNYEAGNHFGFSGKAKAKASSAQSRPRRGKDGRVIAKRKAASSRKGKREQLWPKENMEKAFKLWEENKDLPPDKRLSKHQIAITCEIPYTTVCERLSGRHGAGKTGKIAGGKRKGRVLDHGKQAGNSSG